MKLIAVIVVAFCQVGYSNCTLEKTPAGTFDECLQSLSAAKVTTKINSNDSGSVAVFCAYANEDDF
jgi:hypothetical protein